MSIRHPIPEIRHFQNLTLKIQGQGHGRGTLKVTTLVQHSVDSNPFRSMSICHPIPELQHFQNLNLKIQGQGHEWRRHWKSQSGYNILWTYIPFIPCQSAIPFLRYDFFKIWPWKSKVKVMEEEHWKSQHWSNILSTQIPLIPCQSAIPFLRYDFFKTWPWKSKVKVMGEVDIKTHSMGPTFYRFTSLLFHVNRPSHSWDITFSKFDLEKPRLRSWVRGMLKVTKWI